MCNSNEETGFTKDLFSAFKTIEGINIQLNLFFIIRFNSFL